MQTGPESLFGDLDQLKVDIKAAIRRAIQDEADELGISYDECRELMLGPGWPGPSPS